MNIFMALLIGSSAHAMPLAELDAPALIQRVSFAETFERYPSTFGFIQQLRQIYPHMTEVGYHRCMRVGKDSAPVTGAIDPLYGAALEDEPGALFFPYFESCVRDLMGYAFYGDDKADSNARTILGEAFYTQWNEEIESECKTLSENRPVMCVYEGSNRRMFGFWYATTWTALKSEQRVRIMKRFVLYLVGPDTVLRRLDLIGENSVFGRNLLTADDLAKFLSDEFGKKTKDQNNSALNVGEVYAETAIVLRLGPALKN